MDKMGKKNFSFPNEWTGKKRESKKYNNYSVSNYKRFLFSSENSLFQKKTRTPLAKQC